ncbi:DUF302 domain-containing protein [Vibrio coralliirubri]|uniref:DUF302 domain-containing protein n=1 Tax=Vibrio coralliirubri TaxID=1516159 RepID=UPI0006306134|nr:DUF302 domain-containing protein [Vibrio coralliirubri]CDT33842.1 conserved exported hypothetical protein [Vibrio coralliirubri]CDT49432.1 conserved exported hypothetical protein [Vibrio coralliirubri]CDU03126.1 conserved exported hypothetical protein [Vibrio coralliirubri]
MKKLSLIALCVLPILGCETTVDQNAHQSQLNAVDESVLIVDRNAEDKGLDKVLTIDHSRLAEQANEYLAPSRVDFYTDDQLNTQLLKDSLQVGLDLPFRVLNYVENGEQKVIYTDAQFIQKRHGIMDNEALEQYAEKTASLTNELDNIAPVQSEGLTKNYGIETLVSEYDFETTLNNIKRDVLAQGDTVWFMNWDFKARAEAIGESLPNATLLVFGGPAPGAKAMTDFPSIGLDAFGQKVLVTEENGQVTVAYNNIVDMSEIHYQDNAISHKVINFRLGETLGGAVEK